MEEKLQAAKNYLGTRYVMHKDYDFKSNPHHCRQYKNSFTLQTFLVQSGAILKGRV